MTFCKVNHFKYYFYDTSYSNVLRFFTALQPFFYVYSLKRGTKWRRFWVQRIQFKNDFLLKLKSIIVFMTRSLFFHFLNGHIHNIVSTWLNVCKSTLKMTTLRRRWFDVVQRCKFQRWRTQRCFNVDLTLYGIATSYQHKNNVEMFAGYEVLWESCSEKSCKTCKLCELLQVNFFKEHRCFYSNEKQIFFKIVILADFYPRIFKIMKTRFKDTAWKFLKIDIWKK